MPTAEYLGIISKVFFFGSLFTVNVATILEAAISGNESLP